MLEVAIALAGFSVGEAEGLRRAMSRKRSEAAILRYRRRFIEGAMERGVDREVAERVYGQIEGFSGFGFPKSHSAAFGLLAYQSTWLRVHYGPEFLCALLNEQPMGFYPPDALVHEAQRRGIEVLAPDVNLSELDCRVETVGAAPGARGRPPVRVGLGYVAEVAEDDARAVVAERERGGPYRDVADLAGRSGASRAALRRLAWAGACDALLRETPVARPGSSRFRPPTPAPIAAPAPALWEAGAAARAAGMDEGTQLALPLDGVPLPRAARAGAVGADGGRLQGDGDDAGPPSDGAAAPDAGRRRSRAASAWRTSGTARRVRVAGMVVARQRPATAKGVVFMLLEDELGMINLVVPPPVAERFRLVIRTAGFVLATGTLERREGTTNVVALLDRAAAAARDAGSPGPAHRSADSARDGARRARSAGARRSWRSWRRRCPPRTASAAAGARGRAW